MDPSLTNNSGVEGSEKAPSNGISPPNSAPPKTGEHNCSRCGGSMAAGQDWCLHCGAGAPGSLRAGGGLGSVAAIIAVSVVLVLGAAAAAYAAFKEDSHKPVKVLASTPASTPTSAPGTTASTPASTIPTIPTTGGSSTPTSPPKIPLSTPTPESSSGSNEEANNALFPPEKTKSSKTKTTSTTTTGTKTTGESTKESTTTNKSESETPTSETKTGGEPEPSNALVLDTDAASTYDPYNYPESDFGEPSLAIDGDPTTAWTAQVQPTSAPLMAVGLLIDLKSPQKVAKVGFESSSIGMSIQIFGARGTQPPPLITDSRWVQLIPTRVVKKKSLTIKLRATKKPFRFIVLWITKAPAESIGTPTEPGHVNVNEVKLFPPS